MVFHARENGKAPTRQNVKTSKPEQANDRAADQIKRF